MLTSAFGYKRVMGQETFMSVSCFSRRFEDLGDVDDYSCCHPQLHQTLFSTESGAAVSLPPLPSIVVSSSAKCVTDPDS